MIVTVMSLVVLCQVGLFQILTALANKSLLHKEFGLLETPVPDRLAKHNRQAPVRRIVLGIILACLILLPLSGLAISLVAGKILLVSVSTVSALAYGLENNRDRRMMGLLARHTPNGNRRCAALEPRSLRQWYHPALEMIPLAFFVATLLFLTRTPAFITADETIFPAGRTVLLALFGLQGLLVFGSQYYALRKGVDVKSVAAVIPSLRQRPETALRLGEEMAGTHVRFFMFLRVGIAAILGVTIVKKIFAATGNPGLGLWEVVGWVLAGVQIMGFALYLKKVGSISRLIQHESELAYQETAEAE